MTSVDELVTWLRAQLDDDERVAREASRSEWDGGQTPTGEHWQWEETDDDQVLSLDPMLDEYLNEASAVALRSVEQYPTGNPWTLPHFVVSGTEEMRTVDAMHIARWDPARVLAEIDAKRQLLQQFELRRGAVLGIDGCETGGVWDDLLRMLALPYAGREGYREEWRP